MRISKNNLPADEQDRLQFLINYFSGKDIKIDQDENDHVDIVLTNHTASEYYIDTQIKDGLEWWNENITIAEIPNLLRDYGNYQLSLNDNWTMYKWSQWLERKQLEGSIPEEIVILHIDDHTDCMPPLLFEKDETLINPFSSEVVNVYKPDTIKKAIDDGAISIGSFMTVFLHALPTKTQVRHLMPEHRLKTSHNTHGICRDFVDDNIIAPFQKRPSVRFSSDNEQCNIDYLVYTHIDDFLDNISSNASILVHVDMDYFNNRFDGDSDWESHDFIHDPSSKVVYKNVGDVFSTILKSNFSYNIESYTVALSPGFFPVEFWKKSISIIDDLLINKA